MSQSYIEVLDKARPKRGSHRAPKNKTLSIVLPAVLVIVGLVIMLYPVVSTTWNNYQTRKAAADYAQLDWATPTDTRRQDLEEAHTYNATRARGAILDPWAQRLDSTDPDYREYLGKLDEHEAMARVVIPKINADLPIYHGTSEQSLQKGVGHLYGTALPVGGTGTHSVLTGHTGLPNNTMFDNLNKLTEGDEIYIQVSGEVLKYQVHGIDVVLPEETDSLAEDPNQDLITLITCTPYGINTHRILVHAHRVPMPPEEAQTLNDTGFRWQWWMYALTALAVVILLFLATWISRAVRAGRAARQANAARWAAAYPANTGTKEAF